MPYPKNKYRKGYIIFGMSELCYRLEDGKWVYLRDKVMHPGFMLGMHLRTIMNLLEHRQISEAIDQQKEYYGEKVRPYAILS